MLTNTFLENALKGIVHNFSLFLENALKGIVHNFSLYRSNLIFWIVMVCGIADFVRRGL